MKASNIDLNALQLFFEVAQTKSIDEVSKKVGVTRQTVSKAIKALQTTLDAQLFVRKKTGMHLTADGQKLFHYASQVNTSNHKILEEFHLNNPENAPSELKITSTKGYAGHVLMRHISAFSHLNPDIKIRIFTTDKKIDEANFYGDISFSIDQNFGDDFDIQKCDRVTHHFIAHQSYFKNRTIPKHLEDLQAKEHHVLGYNLSDYGNRRHIDRFLSDNGIEPHTIINNLYFLYKLAESGLAIFLCPSDFEPLVSNQDMLIFKDIYQLDVNYYAAFKKNSLEKDSVKKFKDFLTFNVKKS